MLARYVVFKNREKLWNGLGIRQSGVPKSLWIINLQYHSHLHYFCQRCNNPCRVAGGWRLEAFWIGETVQPVRVCGEKIELLESCTYFRSVVQNKGGSSHDFRPTGLRCYGFVRHNYMALSIPVCKKD